MIFEEKRIILKDGREAFLRTPEPCEGEQQLALMKTVSGETDFLVRYPEEWDIPVEKEESWINSARNSPNELVIAAYADGELAGNCSISFRMGKKTGHRAGMICTPKVRQTFGGAYIYLWQRKDKYKESTRRSSKHLL